MAFHKSTKIVTVDIPDPDNFLMVLRVLKDNPKEKISVVLSPRPVDLRAIPYGPAFGILKKAIEDKFPNDTCQRTIGRLMGRVGPDNREWVSELEEEHQQWFYNDAGFGNPTIDDDTDLYMQVSALRLITYLEANKIERNQYQLYRNEKAKDTISVGMRHAGHKPDWSWNFSDSLKNRYSEALEKARDPTRVPFNPLSTELRHTSRKLLHSYLKTTCETLFVKPDSIFEDFASLMKLNHDEHTRPDIYVGGPFTEAATYSSHEAVNEIVGMGGFINGGINIFPNQFNFLVDMKSAQDVLSRGEAGDFDLTLVPTECAKGSPYEFTADKDADGNIERSALDKLGEHIGDVSPETMELYKQWASGNCSLFDLMAAMYVTVPELFSTRNVSSFMDNGILRFREDPSGRIKMCWNDNAHMERNKAAFHKALRDTFREPAPRAMIHRANSSL